MVGRGISRGGGKREGPNCSFFKGRQKMTWDLLPHRGDALRLLAVVSRVFQEGSSEREKQPGRCHYYSRMSRCPLTGEER